MSIFSKNPRQAQKKSQKQSTRLDQFIIFLQTIEANKDRVQKIYSDMIQYNNCRDQVKKQLFRLKLQNLISQVNKQSNFIQLIQQNIKIQQNINRDIKRFELMQEEKKFQKQIIDEIQTISKSSEKKDIKLQNFSKLKSYILGMKINTTKYDYVLKALTSFQKRQKNFVEYMGQADLSLFSQSQFSLFQNFVDRINKNKVQLFSIKENQQLQIISKVIDQMENAQSVQSLQKITRKSMDKIKNQGFFTKVICKQKQKLTINQYIEKIQKYKDSSSKLPNLGKQIQMNVKLSQRKIRNFLYQICMKLCSAAQCEQVFRNHHISMTEKTITQIFTYLDNLQNILKRSLGQLESKVNKQQKTLNYLNNEQQKYPKYLNLSKYFQKLILFIDKNFLFENKVLKQPNNNDRLQEKNNVYYNLKKQLQQKQQNEHNKLVKDLQQKIVTLQKQNTKILNKNKQLEDKIKVLEQKNQQLLSNNQKLTLQTTQFKECIQEYKKEAFIQMQEIKNLYQKFQKQNKMQLQNPLKAIVQKKQNIQQFSEKIQYYQNKIKYLLIKGHFFGQIFTSQLQHSLKEDLLCQIHKTTGKNVASTQKIYALDKKNPVSPHKYVDDVPDWVFLVKLRNGFIVGGYGHDAVSPVKKEHPSNVGFMFSLNAKKFYTLQSNNPKASIYQYQEFYLMVGNSEIRLNLQTCKVETQFGGKFKYFDTGKDTVEIFFGQKAEKFEVETYEFYHLMFE